ncbi:MAG: hypothetical protein JO281_12485 [Pseudonocardiales bacterium]|nr:hypothetical protein [Pseudonocardiales bacterium]
MHNEGGRAGQDTDNQRHGTSRPTQLGIGRSLRPGTGVPARVLVADMGDGSLFLQGWRDGPSVHLSPADAVPLRRELAAAFGGPARVGRGEQGEAW